jgi:hypothetical protein
LTHYPQALKEARGDVDAAIEWVIETLSRQFETLTAEEDHVDHVNEGVEASASSRLAQDVRSDQSSKTLTTSGSQAQALFTPQTLGTLGMEGCSTSIEATANERIQSYFKSNCSKLGIAEEGRSVA